MLCDAVDSMYSVNESTQLIGRGAAVGGAIEPRNRVPQLKRGVFEGRG